MSPGEIVILGIDPGTATTGYGVLVGSGGKFSPQKFFFGIISTSKSDPPQERLKKIYQDIMFLIERYHPDEIALEKVFFNKNIKTALAVGEARGVVLLCAAHKNVPVYEYTPLQVKQSVVGYGHATKEQVQYMVRSILRFSGQITPDDAADALAIALCHVFQYR